MLVRFRAVVFLVVLIVLMTAPVDSADYSCTNCFLDQSSGGSHACAVREDGSATCWGKDGQGQSTPPSLDPAIYDFVQISAGLGHTCAIVDCDPPPGQFCLVGNARCWGWDDDGQASPGLIDRFSHLSAGDYHTCGLKVDNSVACWGYDGWGQATVPSPPSGRHFTQVSAGGGHTCAITECDEFPCLLSANVMCWGRDSQGQTNVPGVMPRFSQISAGQYHTCGVKTDETVVCWGDDGRGQATPPGGSFKQVSAGSEHTCGVRTDGSVACWGYDMGGQGNPPSGTFEQVSAGSYFTCGLRSNGSLSCWGNEAYNLTRPTAGLCGLFRSDFEDGGDCRWTNGSTPCWTADCDGDGFVSDDSVGYCVADMPIGLPPECPSGTWIDQAATCGAYDCDDDNSDVYAGQEAWFSAAYDPGGGIADRFDYSCDGVEQKQETVMSTSVCCLDLGGHCLGMVGGPGCDPWGWDTATVSDVPECGETADYLVCAFDILLNCVQTVQPVTQTCR